MKTLLAIWLVCALPAFGALSATTVLEVRTTGADTNGGGYSSGGTDMSIFDNKNAAACSSCQSATVNISTTDGVTNGTTTITSATGNYSSALIGNLIYVTGGTGSVAAAWYQVASVTNATTIVVDRSTGLTAGTGVTINIGGALLSPSIANGLLSVAGMNVFIKAGTYTITSNSTNTAHGALGITLVGSNIIQGYSTNRVIGNTDTQPVIQNAASTITTDQGQGAAIYMNITFDGNSQTSSKFTAGSGTYVYCTIKNYNTASSNPSTFVADVITANSASPIVGIGTLAFSEVYSNTGALTVTTLQAEPAVFNNLFYLNASGPAVNISTSGYGAVVANNVFYANSTGITVVRGTVLLNNVFEANTVNGVLVTTAGPLSIGSSTYNNGTAINGTLSQIGTIANTTGSFFTNAASNIFTLNALANQGQLLRATAYAGYVANLFPRGLTATSQDMGAAQHGFVTVGIPSLK